MVYSNTSVNFEPWEEEELKREAEQFKNYKQQEQAEQKAYQEGVKQETQQFDQAEELTNQSTGQLKTSFEQKDPKQFGLKENLQEAGNAVAGAAVDIADSIVSIPQKIVDPRFYTNPDGSSYRPNWLVSDMVDPVNRTVWGNAIRRVAEFGGLMALTRRAAGGAARVAPGAAKAPLNYLAKGPKMTPGKPLQNLGKNVAYGAAIGAPADLVASTSTEANLARELINLRPDWEDALEPFATHEKMSPLQRSVYNMVEGLGIGAVMDVAVSGAGAVIRSLKGTKVTPSAARAVTTPPMEGDAFLARARELSEKKIDVQVDLGAQRQVEMDFVKDPLTKKPWKSMSEEEKFLAKQAYAKKRGLDWGDDTNPSIKRQTVQDNNETDVAITRLEMDPEGNKGFDAYINSGGDSAQGRATSTTRSVVDSMESVNQVYRDPRFAEGTPNNFITRNALERMNSVVDGTPITQTEFMKRMVDNDPTFQDLLADLRSNSKSVDSLMPEANRELAEVMAGRKKVYELSDDEFNGLFEKTNVFEGNSYYSDLDQAKASLISSILNREIRDFAVAAKSVESQVNVAAKDGLLDQMLSRWVAVGRGIKESNYLRSVGLSNLKPKKADITAKLADIANSTQATTQVLREAIEGDATDDLLKLVLDAFSSNDKLQTWADLDTFFQRKLMGYKDNDVTQQSAISRELGSMMINSVISGPKTPVRAAFGTGFVTFSRPVFTAIGASLRGDQRQLKAAFHQVNSLFDATGDAWKVFRKQLKSNFEGGDIPDLGTVATRYNRTESDLDWEMLGNWVQNRGSDAQQAAYGIANVMRNMNRNVLLTWSSRVMNASDLAFHTIIGKQKASSEAFLKAYDEFTDAGIPITDKNFPKLVNTYESALSNEIFDDSGLLRDSFAKFAADEAAMTKEIPKWVSQMEQAFQAQPLLRPFLLFTRTGYNALELTGKHTPFINNFIKEVHDIKNLPTGDKALLQYGIRNADEHEAAKALIRGREAMGGMTILGATSLYLSGRLTGNGPQDKQLRDTWIQQGWSPRSILLPTPNGPAWVSYDSLEPFNGFLAFVADVGDVSQQMGEQWTTNKLGQAWYLIQANIVNRSFFFGLSQLSEIFSGGAEGLEKYAANLVNSQVPLSSMRNEIGRLFNPGMRELEAGFFDNIKNRNLWAGELAELPYRYDVLDGSMLKMWDAPTRMWNAVMPFQINLNPSDTRQMLFRSLYDVKTTVNTLPDGIGEVPATLKSRYQMLIGKQNIEAQLARLFKNPQIQASIVEMERDRDDGKEKLNDPMTYLHNREIKRIFDSAKKNAYLEMQQDAETSALLYQAKKRSTATELRKRGRYTQEDQMLQLMQSPMK